MINKEKISKLEQYIESQPKDQSSLISVLHFAQNEFGYLPEEIIDYIGESLNVPTAKVYGVVSFYSYFNTEPKGENVIDVCMGTACFVKKADEIVREFETALNIKSGETTEDKKYTLTSVRCVGACGLAPVVTINGKVFGNVQVDDVKGIVEKLERGEI